ncbi:MAG: helix-hairpin-helix domain-containing protein [Paludibacteraceae bacterium]|nr:helix-hairpin-helix domain-containing protein [Paludibacteraceae bacterium]
MKTKLHFTRGEWAAALFLLTLMTAGNIYYFLCDIHPKPPCDVHQYEAQFQRFADEQKRLDDSIAAARQRTYDDRPRIRSDTLPPFKSQQRQPMYDIVKLDLNSCDTDALVTVPQFGSKRAAKLVEYREKLGGFHSFSQLQEVYVMQNIDTTKLKTYLYINPQKVKKLNVNTATYQELVSHPYIDAYLTKLILKHREKNGPIHDLDELQRITHAYPELIEKLRPYLVFS